MASLVGSSSDPRRSPGMVGPYRLLSLLDRGGMSVVHRAIHTRGGQHAAIKTIDAPGSFHEQRWRREIALLRGITHPDVVSLLGSGEAPLGASYAMVLVGGESLGAKSRRMWRPYIARHSASLVTAVVPAREGIERPRSPARLGAAADLVEHDAAPVAAGALGEVAAIVRALAGTLSDLHASGILHGDIKPDNVLLSDGGAPLLIHFGLGSWSRASAWSYGGKAHAVRGTAKYLPPELSLGSTRASSSEMYSRGCLLYELLCGRTLFSGDGYRQIEPHLASTPIAPRSVVANVPAALRGLTMRLVAKEPQARCSAAEAVKALQQSSTVLAPLRSVSDQTSRC